MTAGGRKKTQRAMVVAGNYNGVAGNTACKLCLPAVVLDCHMALRLAWGPFV